MYNIKSNEVSKTIGRRLNGNVAHSHKSEHGYEALGTNGTNCVIYSKPLQQVVELTPKQLSEEMTLALNMGRNFIVGHMNADVYNKYVARDMGLKVIEECQSMGPFGSLQKRGRGFWRGEDGETIINGTTLTDIEGNPLPRRQSSYVYESAGDTNMYYDTIEASESDARAVYDLLTTFNFTDKESASLRVLGWYSCAIMPAMLPWRPALMLQGETGLGKSALSKHMHWLLGSTRSERVTGKRSSVAGVEQCVRDNAIAMLLDELEAGTNTSGILEYNRGASEGIQGVKGSSNFTKKKNGGLTCFMFGGINPPKMEDADSNRLLMVKMDKSKAKVKQSRHFLFANDGDTDDISRLTYIGNGMCARVLRRCDELITTSKMIKSYMLGLDYTQRVADTYSPAIAGAWIMLNNGQMSESMMLSFVAKFKIDKEDELGSLATNMFSSILNIPFKTDTTTTTINFAIRDYVKASVEKNKQITGIKLEQLSLYGIRLDLAMGIESDFSDYELTMTVKSKHNDILQALVKQSNVSIDFEGILMQQSGAKKLANVVRIGGIQSRVVSIPLAFTDYFTGEHKEVSNIKAISKYIDNTITDSVQDLDFSLT